MIRFLSLCLTALFLSYSAQAQVRQSGTVTPRHAACWTANGAIQDCGTAASPFLTSIGTIGGGPTICANSAANTGAYNQLCLGASTSAAARISLQNYGGAAAQSLEFFINGASVLFPSTAGGTIVTGTGTFVSGHYPCFTGTLGVIQDCGALGTMAFQNASAVVITGGTITGLPTPTAVSDAANKSYVDALAAGLLPLAASRLATAAVLPNTPSYSNGSSGVGATLTAGSNGALTVDSVLTVADNIILVKNQVLALQNGIYTVTQVGDGSNPYILTRATYFDTAAEMLKNSYTNITAGTVNAGYSYILATTVATVGSSTVDFLQFSSGTPATSLIGTIPSANLVGAYTGITGLGTLASLSTGTASNGLALNGNSISDGYLFDARIGFSPDNIFTPTTDGSFLSGRFLNIVGSGDPSLGTKGLYIDQRMSSGLGGYIHASHFSATTNNTWSPINPNLDGPIGVFSNSETTRGGAAWGINTQVQCNTVAATSCIGVEIDTANRVAGSLNVVALTLVSQSTFATTPAANHIGMNVINSTGAVAYHTAIRIGTDDGLGASDTILNTSSGTINRGIDFSFLTFTGPAILLPNNSAIQFVNPTGTPRTMVNLDASNVANFGVDVKAALGGASLVGVALSIKNTTGTCTFTPAASGDPAWSCSSDMRLKSDISDSALDALAWVNSFRVRDFTLNADGRRHTGAIAQEIAASHPDMVGILDDGILTLSTPNAWKMVRAIQQLSDEVTRLKTRQFSLRTRASR